MMGQKQQKGAGAPGANTSPTQRQGLPAMQAASAMGQPGCPSLTQRAPAWPAAWTPPESAAPGRGWPRAGSPGRAPARRAWQR